MNKSLNRRNFLKIAGATALGTVLTGCTDELLQSANSSADKPNFIIIFCDDLGYGDLGCFGSKKHRTPNIDRMADEGMRFTSFYVTSGVCTPSRSSLMTGCYPRRVNMHESGKREWVLFPVAKKGLNPNEITIAEVLKSRGYATACVGKWHLGDQPKFLPTRQGFDYYYGIPYSNDMGSRQRKINPPLPLLQNEKVIEAPADQNTLTKRYTEQVIKFITANKDKPFFVYLPHTMPHNPVHSSDDFRGKSANDGYGDCVEEIDFSTGQILQTLKSLNIDDRTLVVFTSDNGAASRWGGSNLPLSGFKGSTAEGGMREPAVMRWPGKIPAGKTCDELSSTLDLMPTFALLTGTKAPTDRIIDGKNIWPLMAGKKNATSPHKAFYYYKIDQLQAVRSGKWKLHLPFKIKKRNQQKAASNAPLKLYDLEADIAEKNNVADQHPDVVKRLLALAEKARRDLGDVDRKGTGQRPAGLVVTPKPLLFSSK
ncbi:MAG: sulfatase-like hydrolase/transferase [Planctomycetota bacterium]